ncbi:hypothetical protein F7234_16595 [Pseudomonas putida]|uniref:hypothetical protein n=1 Tax=Pseudomonas putida TaxID=303 RepID=UPI00125F3116|nr:hypothetical protein [Pseudomonas putida]KAB5621233.1 hypothetical protein F7234_16595 [Pseudomonas putida]
MPRQTKDAPEATHFALLDDIVDILVGGRLRPHAILDCITRKAAEALKDTTWRNLNGEQREALSRTTLLSVPLDELCRAHPRLTPESGWLSFDMAPAEQGSNAENTVTASYVSLSGTNEENQLPRFTLSNIKPTSHPFRKLAFLTGLQARKQEILEVLDNACDEGLDSSRNVVVYDIGQGSATALVDWRGRPVIFFDLGWPTSFNARTRPAHPPALFDPEKCPICRETSRPPAPVILSHWDFDHWAYAIENDRYDYTRNAAILRFKPEAINRPWILPKPPRIGNTKGLGPTHMRLLTELPNRLLWPTRLPSVSFSAGTVTRTDSKVDPCNRNNQGLAWFVRAPDSTETLLLPGDASYDHIRLPTGGANITGLLASHHGGIATGIATHLPVRSANSKLVISVGKNNIHRHPNRTVLTEYHRAGWSAPLLTETRLPVTATTFQTGSVLMSLWHYPWPHFSGHCPCICTCVREANLVPTQY